MDMVDIHMAESTQNESLESWIYLSAFTHTGYMTLGNYLNFMSPN